MPTEPVTREAVERWLRKHNFTATQFGSITDWFSPGGTVITALNDSLQVWPKNEEKQRHRYSDLLLTEGGIYGRIA